MGKGRIIYVNLLMNEVNPSAQHNSAIKLAERNDRIDVVKLLLKDERVRSSRGGINTAIKTAASFGQLNWLKTLLEGEADPSGVNGKMYAIDGANEQDQANIIKWILLDKSFSYDDIILEAIEYGSIETLKILLEDGRFDPSINHNKAIQKAVSSNNPEIVKLLMSDTGKPV